MPTQSIDATDVVLYDENGNIALVVPGAALPGARSGVLMCGSDGANARELKVDAAGRAVTSLTDGAGNPISSFAPGLTGVRSLDVVQQGGPIASYAETIWAPGSITSSGTIGAPTTFYVCAQYTVPAGKVFYMLSWEITRVSPTAVGGRFNLRLDSVDAAVCVMPGSPNQPLHWGVTYPIGVPLALAGEIVRVGVIPDGSAQTTWFGRIVGFIRDA